MDSDKVSKNNYIHDDLSFYILSKLPTKSLKRFECVRKSWSILFENSRFMNMYRNHFMSNHNNNDDDDDDNDDDSGYHTFLLVHYPEIPLTHDYRYHAQLHLLPPDQTFNNTAELNFPPPFEDNDNNLQILGSTSVNGILCFKQHRFRGDENKSQFVLWNPATNEFVVVPPSPDESGPRPPELYNHYAFHGFGYDKLKDDFKLIQYVMFQDLSYDYSIEPRDPLFVIYTLRSNSWRILDINMPNNSFGFAHLGFEVYLDGICHWLASQHNKKCLLSFDLSNEVLFMTPMDENPDFSFYNMHHLVVLNGSIALISNHDSGTTLEISVLGELGIRESWIKLFIIDAIPSFEWMPIGVGKKGYIFFRKEDDELAWVDLNTQIVKEIGVKGEENCCKIGIYKESLFPIGRLTQSFKRCGQWCNPIHKFCSLWFKMDGSEE